MTICKRCGKENQDHFKFCLGCGGELSAAPAAPQAAMAKTVVADPSVLPSKPATAPTPPGGVPAGMARGNAPGQGPAPMGGHPWQGAPTPFTPAPGGAPAWGAPPPSAAPLPGVPPMARPNTPQPVAPAMANPGMGAPPVMGPPPGMSPAPAGYGPATSKPKSAAMPASGAAPMGAPPSAPSPFGPAGGGFGAPAGGGFGAPAAAGSPAAGPSGPGAGAATRPCPNCGFEVPLNFMFCGACGQKLTPAGARPSTASPQAATPVAATPAPDLRARGRLTLIRPDGTEGGALDLEEGENRIGRQSGPLFENDGYLSPIHAELHVKTGGHAVVRDADSLNGVFVKITGEEEISPGDTFRIGQELIRFDTISAPAPLEDGTEIMGSPNPGYWGRLSVIIGKDIEGSAFPLLGDAVTMGRERGDINFPDDGYVSGLHARLTQRAGKFYLNDLGSSNGTFLKIRGERALQNGFFILLGQQLFRVNLS